MFGGSRANHALRRSAYRDGRNVAWRLAGDRAASFASRPSSAAFRAVRARPLARVLSAVRTFRATILGAARGGRGLVRAGAFGRPARSPAPGPPHFANPVARWRRLVRGLRRD